MKEYIINVGCNDPRYHKQILPSFMIRRKIIKIISKHFDGFTLTSATGFYKGEKENSFIVYIYGDNTIRETVTKCAEELRKDMHQEAVIVSAKYIRSNMIEEGDKNQ